MAPRPLVLASRIRTWLGRLSESEDLAIPMPALHMALRKIAGNDGVIVLDAYTHISSLLAPSLPT